jgi:hypothetical protein
MFVVSKIAEVAGGVAGICYGDVAESRTATANEFQHINSF